MKQKPSCAREAAALALAGFERSKAHKAKPFIDAQLAGLCDPRERHAATDLFFEVIRWKLRLDHIISAQCRSRFPKHPLTASILRIAAAEIVFNKNPQYAVVHEAVEAAFRLCGRANASFVNAALRKIASSWRDTVFPREGTEEHLSLWYSYPLWLVKRWTRLFGYEKAREACVFFNKPPVVCARLNCPDDERSIEQTVSAVEKQAGVSLSAAGHPLCYLIRSEVPIAAIRGFQEGLFTIQDSTQVRLMDLLDVSIYDSVLDLCAGMGGKTGCLLARNPKLTVTAIDNHLGKLKELAGTMKRLKLHGAFPVCSDMFKRAFNYGHQAVVLDAPCSNLGTLARRPEIKWRLCEQEISRVAGLQKNMIVEAARQMPQGAVMLYTSCSFDPEETFDAAQTACAQGAFEVIKELMITPFSDPQACGDCGYGVLLKKTKISTKVLGQ